MKITPIDYSELTPELMRSGCFVIGMPEDAYHGGEGVSKSSLDLIARSPAHYYYGAKREQTRAMVIGSAIHCAILEPERFASDYLLLKDVKDRRDSEYKQAIKVHSPDNVLVASETQNVAAMQESVASQLIASELTKAKGWRELSAFVACPETGLVLRCRYDLLTADGRALDLKKTRDARPAEFEKSVASYRYHVQQAHYSRVFELITGEQLRSFTFLAVEDQPPYTAHAYKLDSLALEIGDFYAMRDLRTYAECEASGEWPHPDNNGGVISVPYWAAMDYETQLEGEIK